MTTAVINGHDFGTVLKTARFGFVSADLHGRILWANEAFARMLGYAVEELSGKHITEFTHPSDFNLAAASLTEIAEGKCENYEGERHYLHKNGATVLVGINVSVIRNATGLPQSLVAIVEDRTKHRHAEIEASKLSRAIDQSSTSIMITDPSGRIEYVNSKFTELTGYTATEVIGQTPRLLNSGELPAEHYRELWQTIKSGREWRGEFHNRKKNGELFWEATCISPLFDASGQITQFLAVKEDITARKELEAQLKETIAFNRRIIMNAPMGVLVFETSGRCIVANPAASRIVDGGVSQLLQQDFRHLKSWEDSGMLAAAEATLADGRSREGEFNLITSFGKEVWMTCHFSPIHHFKRPCLLVIMEDRTEAHWAGHKIREQAELLNHVPDAVMLLDAERRIKFWNKGAERIYGWLAAEVIGQTLPEVLYGGQTTPEFAAAMEAVEQRGQWTGEMVEHTKSGKTITVCMRNVLIRDGQDITSILVITTDVTASKQVETQLWRTQRMESLGTLAGGIAHDLNNVLTPVLFSIELLKEPMTEADRVELLEGLKSNVTRAASLIKQVLTFSRGTHGRRILFHPRQVIRDIEQMVAETFPKSIRAECSVPGNIWQIMGNPTQVYQVLLNLSINARDAMPDGGRLTIRLENFILETHRTDLSLDAPPGPYVLFTVSDTGTGISRQVQDRMFEPFFTTKPLSKGTGLGLSTSLGIVKGHGGLIKCYSEVSKGTAFEVYFPAEPLTVTAETAANYGPLPHGRNELLLVVDDEESIRTAARKTLENFGYRVLLAANGAEALALYDQQQSEIALIITDMAMPVMSGCDLIAALRKRNSEVRIIASSGLPSDAIDTGVDHFILKPYTAETMLVPLNEILRASAQKRTEA